MSNFFASVTADPNGVSVPDDSTLVVSHFGGNITLKFQNPAHLKTVVNAILVATAPPDTPVNVPTTPSAVDNLTDAVADLVVEAVEATNALDNEEVSVSDGDSGSETEWESPCKSKKDDPDSSYDTYDGYGMTQDAI